VREIFEKRKRSKPGSAGTEERVLLHDGIRHFQRNKRNAERGEMDHKDKSGRIGNMLDQTRHLHKGGDISNAKKKKKKKKKNGLGLQCQMRTEWYVC